jgi:putative hydrolase of the HAD superfamily
MNAKPAFENHLSAADSRHFAHVETWVFDLDNTLYPHSSRVWPQIDQRITLYITNLFGLDGLSAQALQKYFYHKYGTTLRALIDEYDIDPTDFLDFAHDIDHTDIELNHSLGEAIQQLPGRKLILTNGSRAHADRVATRLGVRAHFEDVFDIAASGYVPKPEQAAYDQFVAKHRIDPSRSAIFEDSARNLVVPHALGMTTVLVLPKSEDPFREAFEQAPVAAPYVDYMTDDLAGFLRRDPALF